tara:strand:- start:1400 stop:3025 length:1626 start_codon:yes stop_codon:yes gene_type:complete
MKEVKLNFIYHLAPYRNDIFDYHIDKLHQYLPKFNNKKIINIVEGNEFHSKEYVMDRLSGLDVEFTSTQNDPSHREAYSFFTELLPKVESLNENEFTFFGHSKSCTNRRQQDRFINQHRLWTDHCYKYTLEDIDDVIEKMDSYDAYGPFIRTDGLSKAVVDTTWHYSGTFFWFKNSVIFSNDWSENKFNYNNGYEAEAFIGKMIPIDRGYCSFDVDGDLGSATPIYSKDSPWFKIKNKTNKRIFIAPVFCDTHLIKYQIPNIIDTINPDYIIYNEGMFPGGPENNTVRMDEFKSKYTLDGKRGFDFEELKDIVSDADNEYSDTKIILNEMNYDPNQTNAVYNYILGCTNFDKFGIELEVGDYIFPSEGDIFHHEDSKEEIEGYLNQIEPNQGFRSHWLDFMESQYYVEKRTLPQYYEQFKDRGSRKICVRYGDMEFYRSVLGCLHTQNYYMLYPTDLVSYHYAWWRPGKYLDMRFHQLNRDSKPGYWEHWKSALSKIRELKDTTKEDVQIRRGDGKHIMEMASYIEIEHPKHIREHENFIK